MAVKIRLQRQGKKRAAYYHIVVADARAKRDGRSIERLGSYNPNTNPATIELNFNSSVTWLENGAIPTDTARAILSYKGVMLKKHLNEGIKKGALTEEQADKKFEAWMNEKGNKIDAKSQSLIDAATKDKNDRLSAEAKINEDRAAAFAAKNSELEAEAAAAAAPAVEEVTEEVSATEEVTEEAPAAEETKKEE